jgi:hypothetical protein
MTRTHSSALLLLCAIALTLGATPPEAHSDGGHPVLVVIASKDCALHDVSVSLLRRVFGGEPTDVGATHLIPFNFNSDDPLRRQFDETVLEMAADEVGRYWVDRRIRGQGMPPRTVPNSHIMKALMAKLPGAIGYVTADQVDASVQVLTVEGKGPKDLGYAMK